MQIKLTFKVDEPFVIPLNYNYQLQSAIYSKLKEVGESDFYHNVGFGDGAKFKGFVFGKLSGKYTLHNKQMCFTDTISFEVRSPVFEFCDALQRSFEQKPYIKLYDSEKQFKRKLELIGVNLMNYHINTDSIICTTDSPVCVKITQERGNDIFCSPENENFIKMIKNNYKNKYRSICNEEPKEIDIKLIKCSKHVVTSYEKQKKKEKDANEKSKENEETTKYWINAYLCKFYIHGDSKSLEFLYNTGLGKSNSAGFGMLNVK